MMKKVGDYKMTDHKIFGGEFTNIYTGFNPNGGNVAIKEVQQSQFVSQPLRVTNSLIQNLLAYQGKNVVQLLQVMDDYPMFYFVCELGETTLEKVLLKNMHYPYPDREALYIWT